MFAVCQSATGSEIRVCSSTLWHAIASMIAVPSIDACETYSNEALHCSWQTPTHLHECALSCVLTLSCMAVIINDMMLVGKVFHSGGQSMSFIHRAWKHITWCKDNHVWALNSGPSERPSKFLSVVVFTVPDVVGSSTGVLDHLQ
eukprot:2250472-Pleurochrysis_carterae.AAC.1